MSITISIVSIVVSVSVIVISISLSIVRKEKVFPDKNQLRRFFKLMITGRYEPPKKSVDQ